MEDVLCTLEKWINSAFFDLTDLSEKFITLHTNLVETEDKKIRDGSVKLTESFLNKQVQLLRKAPTDSLPMPTIFGVLTAILGEAGPYRYETYNKRGTAAEVEKGREILEEILPAMKGLREIAAQALKVYFDREEFGELRDQIKNEIIPLVDNAIPRYMPFRIIQVGRIVDRLYGFIERTRKQKLRDLIRQIYGMKYPRFGTSGIRGRWGIDFDELKAKRVTQAICDYIEKENLKGKTVVVGYDGRINSDIVAEWVSQVCVLNDLKVYLTNRATPTPTLIYWGIEKLGENEIAGVLNCTASHNPVEWQGIKYSCFNGAPAPTWVTDWIGARANQLQMMGKTFPKGDIKEAEEQKKIIRFDPIEEYCHWLLSKERNLDIESIRNYFKDKKIVIDEMYGAGREYLRRTLDIIGVKYKVLHGEEDPYFGDLDYANPEPPFLSQCIDTVKREGTELGLALDPDADRYGVVDKEGLYFRPNQILSMLTDYLIRYKRAKGKIVRTESTSRGVDAVANLSEHSEYVIKPYMENVPSYIEHAFYEHMLGDKKEMCGMPAFATYVGIKYVILEGMGEDPLNRNDLIIGGEESSGLTTKGHIPDKDGIWACLLIMEMVAKQQKSLNEIWNNLMERIGRFYSDRVDIDASDEAKEKLIDFYLDFYRGKEFKDNKIAGLKVMYIGGVRYDNVEVILEDEDTKEQSYLIIRASGTEPLNRIYTESTSSLEKQREIEAEVLKRLEDISLGIISNINNSWQLIDVLSTTEPSDALKDRVIKAIAELSLRENNAQMLSDILDRLERRKMLLEARNRKVVDKWLALLRSR